MKIRAAVLLCLFAGIASAQSTIRPGGGGGSSTITAGTTATSGCSPGGFFYSSSSLVQCGANATNDGTTATFGTGVTVGGAATTPFVSIGGTWNTSGTPTAFKVNVTNTASASGKLFDFQLGGTSILDLAGSVGSGYSRMTLTAAAGKQPLMSLTNGQSYLVVGTEGSSGGTIAYDTVANANLIYAVGSYPLQFGANNRMWMTLATTGAFTIGSSSLGTSVVPLTVTPGTGSTANIQNWTTSAGTTLSYVSSAGRVYANGIYMGLGATANDTGIYAPNGAGINADSASGNTTFNGYSTVHKLTYVYSATSDSALNAAFKFTLNRGGGNTSDGHGVGFPVYGRSGNGTEREMGLWGLQWTTAADATRTSKFVIQNVNSAAAGATTWEAQNGHAQTVGTAPAVSSCGTTPSAVTGSDGNGRLTTGSGGTVQSCTLTFAIAYNVAPACVANDETSILLVRATATTTTLVIDSAVAGTLASQALTYICRGN